MDIANLVWWMVLVSSSIFTLGALVGRMFLSTDTLTKPVKEVENHTQRLLLSIVQQYMGDGIYAQNDSVSHRKNWKVKPTGANWKYFFSVGASFVFVTFVVPGCLWIIGKMLDQEILHFILVGDLTVQRLYFCLLLIYFTVSIVDFDNIPAIEKAMAIKRASLFDKQDEAELDNIGPSTGGDIVTNGKRSLVRIDERAIVYSLFGQAICEVSGSIRLFLPLGFVSMKLFPKSIVQREIPRKQRWEALQKDGDGDGQLNRIQDGTIFIAYIFMIPRGYLMKFAAANQHGSIEKTVFMLNDAVNKVFDERIQPLSYQLYTKRKASLNKELMKFVQKVVREPYENLYPEKEERQKMSKKFGYSDEDTLGIDVMSIQIKETQLSEVVRDSQRTAAASITNLEAAKRVAEGVRANKEAESSGPLEGQMKGILAHLQLVGAVDSKGKVISGKEELAMDILRQTYNQQMLNGMNITNFNAGDNVYGMLGNLLGNSKKQPLIHKP